MPGRLLENLMYFARTLRAAGLPVGPGRVIEALRAVETVGIARRDDLYWTLHAVFVNRQDQRPIFDQAFHVFWRNPKLLERMMAMLLPSIGMPEGEEKGEEISRRLAEALRAAEGEGGDQDQEPEEEEIELDAAMTFSDRELLQQDGFREDVASRSWRRPSGWSQRMRLPIMDLPTRRFAPDRHGRRIDMRATLRAALRSGGPPALRRRNPAPASSAAGHPLRHLRLDEPLFAHLAAFHACGDQRPRPGPRLPLRHAADQHHPLLRHRDVDVALDRVDQDGGGLVRRHPHRRCLAEFNAKWSRRVLGQGAVVLLISDGLDRDAGDGLAHEMERLHKSCRRLIWLNPLLRYDAYEPRSMGARAMMPHVDEFRPVHNLASLADLGAVLRDTRAAGEWKE